VNQYNNLDNPGAHYQSTGPEIWAQTYGEVTNFVAAGSTGGTISGIGGFLKSQNPNVHVTLADPKGSIFAGFKATGVVSKGKSFLVEGVGKENIPGAMNFGVIDDTLTVTDKEAFTMCRTIASSTGLFVGGSSGLNVYAAAQLAEESDEPMTIVTMLCDLGVKYLSKVYNDEWLEENDLL
jgi:cysteine synthase